MGLESFLPPITVQYPVEFYDETTRRLVRAYCTTGLGLYHTVYYTAIQYSNSTGSYCTFTVCKIIIPAHRIPRRVPLPIVTLLAGLLELTQFITSAISAKCTVQYCTLRGRGQTKKKEAYNYKYKK